MPVASPPDSAEGALAQVIAAKPGGHRRAGQVEMARAVAEAIEAGTHLVCEAGPGTGKSFGYLVPAILSGKKVIVATATKSLQDQLATKDLPFLADTLDVEFTWAVVKGRQNYLCKSKWPNGSRPKESSLSSSRSMGSHTTFRKICG